MESLKKPISFAFLVILMMLPLVTNGQSTTSQDGNYSANSTWIGNSPNEKNVDVLILHDVILDKDLTIKKNFEVQGSISGTAGFDIEITQDGDMTIGSLNIDGNLELTGGGHLTIQSGDTVYVNDFNVSNTATVTIEAGAVVYVANDFDIRNSAVLDIHGTVYVTNEFSTSQSAIIQGTGQVVAGSDTNIANTSTVFGTIEECTNCIYSNGCSYILPTVWEGGVNTDWFNDANWTDGAPNLKTAATISSTATNMPVISAAGAACFILLIETGASLEIAGSNTIDIHGDLDVQGTLITNQSSINFIGDCWPTEVRSVSPITFYDLTVSNPNNVSIKSGAHNLINVLTINNGIFATNDSLTLVSDEFGTASIAEIAAGSGVSGMISMERYVDAGPTYWRQIASSVQGATLDQMDDDFATSGYPGSWWPSFWWTSVYKYDETLNSGNGYIAATTDTEVMQPGQGWHVWCGDTITGTQPFVFDFRGVPNQGDIAMPVTYTNTGVPSEDGFNLVGNPYPSTIDWDDPDWTKTNMANAVYIQNPDNQQYATYVAGASTNGGSRYIASQQSFWVQAFAASPVLTAREGVKANNDQAFFKNGNLINPGMTIRIQGDEEFDEAVLRHLDMAVEEFEYAYDANKMWGGWGEYPQLSLINSESKDLTVHSFNKGNQEWSIPLRAIVFENGIYNIEFEHLGELDVPCLQLEDLYTGNVYMVEEGVSLPFEMSDTTYAPRFVLHIGKTYQSETISASCNGVADGEIIIDLDEPSAIDYTLTQDGITQNLNDVANPLQISNLESGIYQVEVPSLTNVCNQTVFNFVVNQPAPITIVENITDETNGNDGVINLNVMGGTAPYTYSWSNGGNSESIYDLTAGTYSVMVEDANGCEVQSDFMVDNQLSLSTDKLEQNLYFNGENLIILSGDWNQELISIYTVDGKLVQKASIKEGQVSLSVQGLKTGIYLLQSDTINKKFFKP